MKPVAISSKICADVFREFEIGKDVLGELEGVGEDGAAGPADFYDGARGLRDSVDGDAGICGWCIAEARGEIDFGEGIGEGGQGIAKGSGRICGIAQFLVDGCG